MAIQDQTTAHPTVFVDTFTDGLLGPDVAMLGPVRDGGHIVWNSTPGCWGPMITPSIRGGHEVCTPVAVEGAEPGDAIAINFRKIRPNRGTAWSYYRLGLFSLTPSTPAAARPSAWTFSSSSRHTSTRTPRSIERAGSRSSSQRR